MTHRIVLALVVCGLMLGQASAQQPPASQAPAAAPKAPPRNGKEGAPKPLTDAEKVEKAADNVVKMKSAMKAVLKRVEDARSEKDVVKLNCVNEKLTQVKGLLKVAEVAEVQLSESIARKDESGDTELQKITMARAKVDQLRGEADQCIGQLAYVVDSETSVEVQVPDNLPSLDVTRTQVPPRPKVDPPVVRAPPASPWY